MASTCLMTSQHYSPARPSIGKISSSTTKKVIQSVSPILIEIDNVCERADSIEAVMAIQNILSRLNCSVPYQKHVRNDSLDFNSVECIYRIGARPSRALIEAEG